MCKVHSSEHSISDNPILSLLILNIAIRARPDTENKARARIVMSCTLAHLLSFMRDITTMWARITMEYTKNYILRTRIRIKCQQRLFSENICLSMEEKKRGRITVPEEVRDVLGVEEGALVECRTRKVK